MEYDVNLSILFTELDLLRRPAAAKRAGFDAVEFWWPFAAAVPPDAEVERFARAVEDAGVRLVGLNFFAGDMPAGERGVLSDPARAAQFADNVDVVVGLGERLGCRKFNALYGNRVDGVATAEQDEVATAGLLRASGALARIGGTVLIEPVSGPQPYPLRTAADALAVIDRVGIGSGRTNLGLLADLYHLAVNGDDIDAVIAAHTPRIAHVQIADDPGRGEPGTGALPLDEHLAALERAGYRGHVALEYKPSGSTEDSFGWLPRIDRAAR